MKNTFIERFWNKVAIGNDDECWLWTGAGDGRGRYGRVMSRPGGALFAHRVSWMLCNGAIPEGMFICHRCDNPPCVNPAHLFLGTQADNLRDMREKGRSRGRQNGGPIRHSQGHSRHRGNKLTEVQVREIRHLWGEGGITQQELANRFGVDASNIRQILTRKTWRHVA